MTYSTSKNDIVRFPYRANTNTSAIDNTDRFASYIVNRTGVKLDNWKSKVRNGLNATTPYSLDRTGLVGKSYGDCEATWYFPSTPQSVRWDRFEGYHTFQTSVTHNTLSGTAANNDALVRILSKIRNERSHLNGLSFAGELRETIHMLRHPYAGIAELMNRHLTSLGKRKRGLSASNPKHRTKLVDIVASTWLETSFGLKPLIQDTKDIAEAIARYEELPPKRSRLKAHGDVTSVQQTTPTIGVITGTRIGWSRRATTETTYSRQYIVGMSSELTADYTANRRLLTTLGFTPENFVPALWEVLPWSWLVDYFSNVGNILEASCTNTSAVTWICQTDRTFSRTTNVTDVNVQVTNNQIASLSGVLKGIVGSSLGSTKVVRRTVTRTIPASLGVPTLSFSYPSSLGRLANLSAVLIQRRKFNLTNPLV